MVAHNVAQAHIDIPQPPRKPVASASAAEPQSLAMVPTSVLAIQRAPELVLQEAARAAVALRGVIESKPSKCVINGKTYLQFEDWQTLGRFYGVTAAARSTTYIEHGRTRGYECHAQALLVSGDQVISDADAMCLDDETKWHDKPIYQLRSMAQTRACAKVLRNVLAWVVVLAGYQPTPAEEIDEPTSRIQTSAAVARIPEARKQSLLERMRKAATREELRKVFVEAYQEANAAGDTSTQAEYIAAKESRFREVR